MVTTHRSQVLIPFTQGNNWQMDADPTKKPTKYSRILHEKFAQIVSGRWPCTFMCRQTCFCPST